MKKFIALEENVENSETLKLDPYKISTWKPNTEPQFGAANVGAMDSIDYMYRVGGNTNSPKRKNRNKKNQVTLIDESLNCW